MNTDVTKLSTGMAGLDGVLQGLLPGDNVVWEVDGIEDYLPVLGPLCREAGRRRRPLIYFRFARHAPLLREDCGAEIHQLQPEAGFETFLSGLLDVIERAGPGAYYIFDCLSDLAADWVSDRMLGNFFLITCPCLYRLGTIAYFALLKNRHSVFATDEIKKTAQVIIEVFRKNNRLFIHPLKVFARHSPTLYTLHSWEGEDFKPVTSSATITDILAGVPHPWLDFTVHRPGVWTRAFRQARQTLEALREGRPVEQEAGALLQQLLKMVLARDERLLRLAGQYFTLADVVEVMKRMIGSGLVGGKSLGMLLARAILKKTDPRWDEVLEGHDSFFVGSDVFYTYLVQNDCWWLRRKQQDFNALLDSAAVARQKIMAGTFPKFIQDQFMEMLEYFGQSPIIARSSSLLEDNYGNAFSGKYESVFCANQGTPQQRLEAFMAAVRTVYASTMSEEGLAYRLHHGLLERDEQMALLVQRVSGEMHGQLFFPQLAGVGFSFNPFVWHEEIQPEAGVLRLVFGLGTRAVERTADDYTRLTALNVPERRPESKPEDVRQFAQRRVDVLDLEANQLLTRDFEAVAQTLPAALLDLFATSEPARESRVKDARQRPVFAGFLTFERLLAETQFAPTMRELLRTLHQAYDYPVDIEFTANFQPTGRFRINLVQCRPFQVRIKGKGSRVNLPETVAPERLVFASRGPIVGQSLATVIDRLVYIVPSVYGQMAPSQRYSVARTIGRLVHLEALGRPPTIMLVGPGRWGTSMPSLGVPVSFAEIDRVSVLCELTLMHEGLVPDVSLGTHFFNDLVEMDMLYLAVSPGREGHKLNEGLLRQQANQLTGLLPAAAEWAEAIRVIDSSALNPAGAIYLNVDSLKQRAVCYSEAAA
jgi:hypothetical protein